MYLSPEDAADEAAQAAAAACGGAVLTADFGAAGGAQRFELSADSGDIRDGVVGAVVAALAAAGFEAVAAGGGAALDGGAPLVELAGSPLPDALRTAARRHASRVLELKDPARYACAAAQRFLPSRVAAELWAADGGGVVVAKNALQAALGAAAVDRLQADFEFVAASGFLAPPAASWNGGVGVGGGVDSGLRGDMVGFLNERECLEAASPPLETLAAAVALMKGAVHALNAAGGRSMRCNSAPQLAQFAPNTGAAYARHRDVPGDDISGDAVTVLLYANAADWQAETQGGQLRVFDDASGGSFEVVPRGGTLVAFRSPQVVHEVLPTRGSAPRCALTLWAREGSAADIHWHIAPGETWRSLEQREQRRMAA